MSTLIFGPHQLPNQPHNYAWDWFALDVGDVFVSPLNGASVTITGVTIANSATTIAYSVTGSFPAGPASYPTFQAWLTAAKLVRSSYRGGSASKPQWSISEQDKGGISSGESTLLR
jgi:hypothetical protein